ncbi:MAG: cytochrome c-type biogenesis CcmF C-terminal domain-containing protein [Chloroflexota bacterium]
MADLGFVSLLLALALASYSVAGSLLGVWKKDPRLLQSARHATYLAPVALGIATASLVGAFVTHDFQVEYVALHSSRAMEPQYIWVAFYAGNEGSLLFIAFVLSILAALAISLAPRVLQASLPYTNVVLMLVLIFFVTVTIFLANPFSRLDFVPADGQGINPLLTHPGMFLHPPMLMTGLIAIAVPFAFAMGALLSGRTGDEWVDAGRTWGILAFTILGAGNLLGMWWAYTILGWGGYWGWDPVENSSLMPWLVITAFIHSLRVQKLRGMFRMWNLALIIIAFAFAQFGMFINRGGPVPSVHSFGQSTLGWVFMLFMIFTLLVSFGLFFLRYNNLKSAQTLESAVSREASFLINNLLFLTIAFVTLWGVIYPLISDIVQGEIITVGQPFYNQVNGPLFLALIFLMGVAPFLPWRHASWGSLRHTLMVPVAAAIAVACFLILVGINKPYAVAAFAVCALVASGILREWVRGAHYRHKRGESYPIAFARLIASNRPRYGGYLVHLAIVLLALGITGSTFYDVQRDVVLWPGESADVGGYTIKYITSSMVEKVDRIELTSEVQVFRGDSFLGTYYPRRDYYPSFNMSSTQATIRTTPIEDLYIIPGESLEDGRALFRILVNPLVMWMWMAGPLVLLGVVVALWPQREVAAVYARVPSRGVVASS